ncbi:hypothetical protein COL93_29690 [Bacillus toyonensis]|uniref:Uncharacterized protein n=1 Tax=Bacillus toyonensis TaxID=155322 RepID=A0A2B5WPM8_9BACI|nr:hypothetical protein COL93_29690 [Bacillus toyonensis]PHD55065.1 hypothetical protein COF40_30200 [Bacillus toyonensis]
MYSCRIAKLVPFHVQIISHVLHPFLPLIIFWVFIPIAMKVIKKEANEIASSVHMYKEMQ